MPPSISQAIQNFAQVVLAGAVLVVGFLGIAALVSERARRVVLDRMIGEVVARASRKQLAERSAVELGLVRKQRVDSAVEAISRGLMIKEAHIDPGLNMQRRLDDMRDALLEALNGATTLRGEFPTLRDHLDKVITLLNDRGTHVGAVNVSREYIQPILDATKHSDKG